MLLLLLLLLLIMMRNYTITCPREHMTGQLRRQRRHPHAAARSDRARVRVLAFVSRHNNGRVVGGPLDPLLHTATSCGATIVAPVTNKTQPTSKTVAFID